MNSKMQWRSFEKDGLYNIQAQHNDQNQIKRKLIWTLPRKNWAQQVAKMNHTLVKWSRPNPCKQSLGSWWFLNICNGCVCIAELYIALKLKKGREVSRNLSSCRVFHSLLIQKSFRLGVGSLHVQDSRYFLTWCRYLEVNQSKLTQILSKGSL